MTLYGKYECFTRRNRNIIGNRTVKQNIIISVYFKNMYNKRLIYKSES